MAIVDWKKIIGLYGPKHMTDSGSTGLGPDFPESAGGREMGKFRESIYPRLTRIAVANDDGTDIGSEASAVADETLLYQKAMVLGLSILTGVDLLAQVSPD